MLLPSAALQPAQDQQQDEGKIAQALTDRLTVPCTHVTFSKHEEIAFLVDLKKKQAQMLWMGNKILSLKVTLRDLQSEQVSIADNFIDLQGNGLENITINRAGNSLGMVDIITGAWVDFGQLQVEEKPHALKFILKEHLPIRITVCEAQKKAWAYFNNYEIFNLSARFAPIKGATPKNLSVMKGSFPREIFLNRSRKILFLKKEKGSMPGTYGTFAEVTVEESSKMK